MLQSLRIRNLAIVEDVRVEFGDGLNVITGETGAGKSVIVGALSLLLGERADKSLIRTGTDQCAVEAVFATQRLNALLEELGLEPGAVIVRRQFTTAGTGKVFINDTPTTVQTLKRIGELLVDMHGPHDHQSLLNRDFQLEILDAYGAVKTAAYREAYRRWLDLQAQRATLNEGDADVAQQIDFLKFQIKEIEQADVVKLDEKELGAEHSRAANANRILELAAAIQLALTDGESSAFEGLAVAQRQLQELAGIVPEAEAWKKEAAGIAGGLQELAQTVGTFAGKIDADPQRLQWLEERLATLHKLKRKYGAGIPEIREFLAKARHRLNDLETRGERAEKLDAEIAKAAGQIEKLGRELTTARRAAAKKLAGAVTKELKDLGFAHGSFGVQLTPLGAPGARGLDEIEFSFAPNVGEPARPLRQIASSGEMSRVMLATKVVLAEHDRVTVLVFDEIDANVGGEMGTAIGEKLRTVAGGHQVICITHLPQVAAQGDCHYVVNKTVQGGRTNTGIAAVTGDARVEEIARMLGGKDSTSVALRHAKEMLTRRKTAPVVR
ncbi:MAG: DNA repair protein RecN [Verrucomicrobiae bacterium]|nr:DNA repair protein RecN [Verrucomicrobiae bacterium]